MFRPSKGLLCWCGTCSQLPSDAPSVDDPVPAEIPSLETPETLPKEMLTKIKREIAKRILSEKKEKWWTCKEFYNECDNLRDKYTNEKDEEKLKFLDEINDFVMSVEKKYENA